MMVTRKSSLPYPASPPPAPPQQDPFAPPSTNLVPDSSDLPPIPLTHRQNHASRTTTSFLDNDNPWNDQPSSQLRSDRTVPDFLKPREGKPAEEQQRQHSLQDIPPALRPGNSGQETPRSSIDSGDSRGFWEDEDPESPGKRSPGKEVENGWTDLGHVHPPAPSQLPPPPPEVIKRKPLAVHQPPEHDANLEPPHPEFASNNPFRRPSSRSSNHDLTSEHQSGLPDWGSEQYGGVGKGKEPLRDPWADSAPTNDFSKMSISSNTAGDQSIEDPWKPLEPSRPPPPPQAPPPLVPPAMSSASEQPPLIPVQPDMKAQLQDPWVSALQPVPSPSSFDQSRRYVSQYNDSMLDRGQVTGTVHLGDELQNLPNKAQPPITISQQPLLDDDDIGPPLPARPMHEDQEMYAPPEGPPPPKPPRPSISTAPLSDAELARNVEDRSETYQIKHFNWFDHSSGRLRSSSMLTQNNNGPCPLLALVNALILGATDDTQAVLDDALRTREQVSLGLIIETLMNELITRGLDSETELPDVDELNAFLLRLKTGMNANPRFLSPKAPPPNLMDTRHSILDLPQSNRREQKTGTFEPTPDMRLYGAFQVPLLHGWLPEPRSDAEEAFRRSAQTYEDAQALQFGEEELEYKLSRNGLTPEEQRMWEDINAIKSFFALYPTQLTPYGLESVQEALSSGSFAIMFRNDHFSTIYKHPQSGQLFTLITDAGYAERDEIIWESLVDISGARNEYFSGDFMPVSHEQTQSRNDSNSGPSLNHQQHLHIPDITDAPLSPQEQQEQHDADFAMALQMQEEDQRQRAEAARRRRSGNAPTGPGRSPRGSAGNIPIPLRQTQSRSDAPENRPTIPPRAGRGQGTGPPAVNRPTDANDDDAPPAYEEAAKGKPYIPPVGSPLHPTYSSELGASANSSNVQLSGTTPGPSSSGPTHPPGINAPFMSSGQAPGRPGRGGGLGMAGRRMSAYNETGSNRMPGAYQNGPPGQGYGPQPGYGQTGRRRGRGESGEDRDCRVM